MNVPQTHLLEYLGAEEANLLVSMNLCKRDMDFCPARWTFPGAAEIHRPENSMGGRPSAVCLGPRERPEGPCPFSRYRQNADEADGRRRITALSSGGE